MNETLTTVVGNVITELRSRLTPDGVRVASFRVASNERRFDKETGSWIDGDRLYVTVTCWRRLANNVLVTLGKGDPVVVIGRLYTRGFEVEGQKRSVTELEATAVGPDLARCAANLVRVRRSASEDVGAEQRVDGAAVAAVVPGDGEVRREDRAGAGAQLQVAGSPS